MKKLNFLLITALVANFSFAQIKADSVRQALNTATGEDRVNLLLEVNQVLFPWKGREMVDSTYYYAKQAYDLASKIGYMRGKAQAARRLSGWANLWKKNCDQSMFYAKEALSIAMQLKSDSLLGDAYFTYAGALQCESKEKNFDDVIDALKKGGASYKAIGYKQGEGQAYWTICSMLSGKGNYEEGLDYCQNALTLTRAAANDSIGKDSGEKFWGHQLVEFSLINIAHLYVAAGDYETANKYIMENKNYQSLYTPCCPIDDAEAELYIKMKQPDSALNILNTWSKKTQAKFFFKNFKGQALLLKKDYLQAIQLFTEALPDVKKDNKFHSYSKLLIDLGSAYSGVKKYQTALKYANEGLREAEQYNIRPYQLQAYGVLSTIYRALNNHKDAYQYLEKYINLKESILNNQLYWRLNNYKRLAEEEKKTSQINLLNKDNQLKEQKLKDEASLKRFLIAGLILLLITGIFIFRYFASKRKNEKLESEKKQAELQQQATDLEMKALRAQMNPHFIFNCLSSINKFILKNDTDTASDYLTRFSRLIRQVLTNSQLSLIPLSDEIEMLRLYLDMERLRFSDSFTYNITYENSIEPETVYVPPMLLQPFCENAIWHGLMHKEGAGKLEVVLSLENGQLRCIIADNGIGRTKAAELKPKFNGKQKSLGLKITTERLALFNNEKTVHNFYQTEDLLDTDGNIAGTKVILKINYKQTKEVTAV